MDKCNSIIKRYFEGKSLRNIFLLICVMTLISRAIFYIVFKITDAGQNNGFIMQMTSIYDNNWYYGIIQDGYHLHPSYGNSGQAANWAFFPLDALLIKLLSFNGLIDIRIAGFIINNIFFIMAMLISYKYIMLTHNNTVLAIGYIFLMTFGPYNFYFSSLYTESLFLLLTVTALYEMEQSHYIKMGIAGCLLSATRVTGVFLCFCVLVKLIQKYRNEENVSFLGFVKKIFSNRRLVLGVSIIPAGLFSYMFYLYKLVGDPLAFIRIQNSIEWRGSSVKSYISSILPAFCSDKFIDIYLQLFLIMIIIVMIYQFKKGNLHEIFVYAIPCAIQFFNGNGVLMGIGRYSVGTGVFVIGFLEMISENFSQKAKLVTFLFLIYLSLKLLHGYFTYNIIAIG